MKRRFIHGSIMILIVFVISAAVSCSNNTENSEENSGGSAGTSVPATSAEAASSNSSWPKLVPPDRIRIIVDDTLYLLTPGKEVYDKLYGRIREAWDRNERYGSHLKVQYGHLDAGEEPKNLARIVLEFDDPIPCWFGFESSDKAVPINTYVLFLRWKRPWIVLCKDENWESFAFLPELEGGIGSIDDLLEGLEGEAVKDPKHLDYYDTAVYKAEDFTWQPEGEPEEGVLDAGSFRVSVPEEWGLKVETVSNDGIVFGYEKDGYTYTMLFLTYEAISSEGSCTAIDAEHERCVGVIANTGFRIWAKDHALGIGDVCAWFAKHTWFSD